MPPPGSASHTQPSARRIKHSSGWRKPINAARVRSLDSGSDPSVRTFAPIQGLPSCCGAWDFHRNFGRANARCSSFRTAREAAPASPLRVRLKELQRPFNRALTWAFSGSTKPAAAKSQEYQDERSVGLGPSGRCGQQQETAQPRCSCEQRFGWRSLRLGCRRARCGSCRPPTTLTNRP